MPALHNSMVREIAMSLNDIVEINENMANEFARVSKIVRQEGKMTERVLMGSTQGAWSTSVDSVNSLIGDLVRPTTEAARVITAVAKGDFSQKDDDRPWTDALKRRIPPNRNDGQLNGRPTLVFCSRGESCCKEVGMEVVWEGKPDVEGVSGIWKDLTDNVNALANNLTAQVRNIAKVTDGCGKGIFSEDHGGCKGEILELKNTINTMVDQLNSFAAEVTRVAKELERKES